ncbi:UNVERIFIED_CONTAM: hypothetical protein K2H54_015502 [Gekko kuhli]
MPFLLFLLRAMSHYEQQGLEGFVFLFRNYFWWYSLAQEKGFCRTRSLSGALLPDLLQQALVRDTAMGREESGELATLLSLGTDGREDTSHGLHTSLLHAVVDLKQPPIKIVSYHL